MEEDRPPRKVRFSPKAPAPRKPNPSLAKKEDRNEDGDISADIMRQFNESQRRQTPKVEEKSSEKEALISPAAISSASNKSLESLVKEPMCDHGINVLFPPSTFESDNAIMCLDAADASTKKIRKDYVEPWDYHWSYYPTTLPLREPKSGDPELLNAEEFGEDPLKLEYDESAINTAFDLGMLEENETAQMFFVQLPINLPLPKQSSGNLAASVKGKEIAGCSTPSGTVKVGSSGRGIRIAGCSPPSGRGRAGPAGRSVSLGRGRGAVTAREKETARSSISERITDTQKESHWLDEISSGYMGKMLVYKSGAMKLKLGETLYDVSPGSECKFAQDIAAINTQEQTCCVLGSVDKRIVITPDINSLLDSSTDLV